MNKKLRIATIISISVFLLCTTFYVFIPKNSFLFYWISYFLFVIIGGVAGITALVTSKTAGWGSKEGKVWLLLGLGFIGWALGEFLWMYNDLILGIEPFPSTADIFYILAYFPMIIGLWIEYSIIKESTQKKQFIISIILTIIATIISTYLVILPIIRATDYNILNKLVSLAYPIGDLLLLFPALIFFLVFKGAKMSKSWLLIAISMVLVMIADTSFAYLDWNGIYSGINLILTDLTWLASYISFAFASYYHKLILEG